MFEIGFGELIVVFVVGLWVLGPKRLPAVMRVFARHLSRAKNAFHSVKREFQQELNKSKLPPYE